MRYGVFARVMRYSALVVRSGSGRVVSGGRSFAEEARTWRFRLAYKQSVSVQLLYWLSSIQRRVAFWNLHDGWNGLRPNSFGAS